VSEDHLSFENDKVKINAKKSPGCQIHFDVSVQAPAAEKIYQDAFKAVSREVSLPGFRKGKAPKELILSRFGKHVDQEWTERLARTSFQEAITLSSLPPLDEKHIKRLNVKECSRETGALVEIEYEFEPKLADIDLSGISLTRQEIAPVEESDIEKELKACQFRHVNWQEVEGRAIEMHDFVDLDIELLKEPKEMVYTNQRFEVKEGAMREWLKNLVLGQSVNASLEAVFDVSETLENTSELADVTGHQPSFEKRFQDQPCRVTVKGIYRAELPELSDALAEKEGYKSLAELRQEISTYLERSRKKETQKTLRQELKALLIEKYLTDMPASLVKHEKQRLKEVKQMELSQNGVGKAEAAEQLKELDATFETKAQQTVFLSMLMRKVAIQADISIYKEEILNEVFSSMYSEKKDELPIHAGMKPEEAQNRVVIKLMIDKSLDVLLEKVAS
jgi:trigger factor